jgi:hypothetical protein
MELFYSTETRQRTAPTRYRQYYTKTTQTLKIGKKVRRVRARATLHVLQHKIHTYHNDSQEEKYEIRLKRIRKTLCELNKNLHLCTLFSIIKLRTIIN